MHRAPVFASLLLLCLCAAAHGSASIVGNWQLKSDQIDIVSAAAAPEPTPRPSAAVSEAAAAPALTAGRRPTLYMQRTWEPNERAFSFLLPREWNFKGGIFNVNPLTQNGPGNSIAPKCDLVLQKDERGTVMIRLAPSWNHADLTYSPTGFGLFEPGQSYQGMPVRVLPPPRQFLSELFQSARPRASAVAVLAEDPMREMVDAVRQANQAVNQALRQAGLKPNACDGTAMLVEYAEDGQRYTDENAYRRWTPLFGQPDGCGKL